MELIQKGMGLDHAEKVLNMIRAVEEEERLKAADTIVPQPAIKESPSKGVSINK